jgi:hypothetical protein
MKAYVVEKEKGEAKEKAEAAHNAESYAQYEKDKADEARQAQAETEALVKFLRDNPKALILVKLFQQIEQDALSHQETVNELYEQLSSQDYSLSNRIDSLKNELASAERKARDEEDERRRAEDERDEAEKKLKNTSSFSTW